MDVSSKFFVTKISIIGLAVIIGACDTQNPQGHINSEITSTIHPLSQSEISKAEEEVSALTTESLSATNIGEQASNNSLVNDFDFSAAIVDEQSKKTKPLQFCLDTNYVMTEADITGIERSCKNISDRLASVSYETCLNAKLTPTQCLSGNGFPLLYREFAPLTSRKPLGRVLIIGGTHGDELTSVSIVFRWIELLNKRHSGLFHWHMVPLMNPDGVLKKSATRTNENGIDLNRNLPSPDWSLNALKYWHDKTGDDPRKYPGEQAASELENQWLIDEINSFKPDAIISVHAPYGIVDFDSPALNTAPKSLGKLRLNLLGTYPGSLGNYAGISLNIPTITLELPHSWIMPSHEESTKIWNDVVSWLEVNMNNNRLEN